jgi:HD-GYP domain-containing protein (c-di-GMP phosphodiesterase class II)
MNLEPTLFLHLTATLKGLHDPLSLTDLLERFESQDPRGWAHAQRVAQLVARTLTRLRIDPSRHPPMVTAALLHDVGRLGLPIELTQRQGRLEEGALKTVRFHPSIGAGLVRGNVEVAQELRRSIREHHERWDGRGYPNGVSGVDIGAGARLIAVCEAFDAMTIGQLHTAPLKSAEAVNELHRGAGTQFDPRAVHAFLRAMQPEPTQPHPHPPHTHQTPPVSHGKPTSLVRLKRGESRSAVAITPAPPLEAARGE